MSTKKGPSEQARGGARGPCTLSRRAFAAGGAACAFAAACGKGQMMDGADMSSAPCDLGDSFKVPEADALQVNQTLTLTDRETIISRDARGYMAMWLRCRHSGCVMEFNQAERSYDCPCHGSRYDIFGQVMQGPADLPLLHREMCRDRGTLTVSMSSFLPDTSKRTT